MGFVELGLNGADDTSDGHEADETPVGVLEKRSNMKVWYKMGILALHMGNMIP